MRTREIEMDKEKGKVLSSHIVSSLSLLSDLLTWSSTTNIKSTGNVNDMWLLIEATFLP
jgi:hypothetical protein